MKRTSMLMTTLFAASFGIMDAQAKATKEKPNIVLVMADDLGPGDISYYWNKITKQKEKKSKVTTPNLDKLASEGMWFTDGHSATSLCSPTRYCVMSGNNNYRSYAMWGVWGAHRETAFKPGEATLGTVTKDAGYTTGFIGKWHLGGDYKTKDGSAIFRGRDRGDKDPDVDMTKIVGGGPQQLGFDYSFMQPSGVQGPLYLSYENGEWCKVAKDSKLVYYDKNNAVHPKDMSSKGPGMGDSNWDSRELGKLISSKAVTFIEESAKKDNPFFLYYCSPMVHVPHCPPKEFDGVKVAGASLDAHTDMAIDFDMQIKRIVDALKAAGEYENTLFVLTSDNGGLIQSSHAGHDSSGEWSGFKNSWQEGGHRVPFFFVWPGVIKPGTINDKHIMNNDMLATFASLVGTKVPKDQAQDSLNLLPLLTGKGTFVPRDFIAWQAGANKELMYQKNDWKLTIKSNGKLTKWEPIALHNMKEHPYEEDKYNMVKHPEYKNKVQKMLKEYRDIRDSGVRTAPYNP